MALDQENSLWNLSVPSPGYPSLDNEIEVDVAIIGGGIGGINCAYLLKEAGLEVAVLEQGELGSKVSGNTTGKVTSQHGLIYSKLRDRLGDKPARIYGEANQTALAKSAEIVKTEKIDCDWQTDDNYVFTTSDEITRFKAEAKAASSIGLPAEFTTDLPPALGASAAVRFSSQAKMHTRKYVLGLAKKVDGQGSFVFEHTKAKSISDGKRPVVKTKNGKIHAKQIILSTNVPFPFITHGAYCALEYPMKSYVIASRVDKLALKGMYISSDNPNSSILPFRSGDQNYMIVGGESHIASMGGFSSPHYRHLEIYAKNSFGIDSIDYRWSTMDYLGYDGLPLVGKLYPWTKNIYVATAFMKWGLTNTMVAAMILRDLITGAANPWADVFNSNRLRPMVHIPLVTIEYLRR